MGEEFREVQLEVTEALLQLMLMVTLVVSAVCNFQPLK